MNENPNTNNINPNINPEQNVEVFTNDTKPVQEPAPTPATVVEQQPASPKKPKNTRTIALVVIGVLIVVLSGATVTLAAHNISKQETESNKVDVKDNEEDKKEPEESNPTEDKKDDDLNIVVTQENYIRVKQTTVVGEKIMETMVMLINNNTKEFDIEFTKVNDVESYFSATLNGLEVLHYSANGQDLTEDIVKSLINEMNFRFIKGEDNKSYLILITRNKHSIAGGEYAKMYIFNEELQELTSEGFNSCEEGKEISITSGSTTYELEDNTQWYQDDFNICNEETCQVRAKIENNKIYYLVPVTTSTGESQESNKVMEERVFTIKDNNFTYTTNKTIKVLYNTGATC